MHLLSATEWITTNTSEMSDTLALSARKPSRNSRLKNESKDMQLEFDISHIIILF